MLILVDGKSSKRKDDKREKMTKTKIWGKVYV